MKKSNPCTSPPYAVGALLACLAPEGSYPNKSTLQIGSCGRSVRRGLYFLSAAIFAFVSSDFAPAFAQSQKSQSGVASVYSTESGATTASGARLTSGALTAAHRSLPFGTKVRVTNKSNGRSVVVTINDRGPFVRGRIIDVTPAAARALGFSGLASVVLDIGG
jgi:peptidoglycan lytic transglycosylase